MNFVTRKFPFISKCGVCFRSYFEGSSFSGKDFVTETEESCMIDEVDFALRKHKYQTKHWDYAVKNFREIERGNWQSATNQLVIDRLKMITAENSGITTMVKAEVVAENIDQLVLPLIHILDLAENGEIMPHVDSVKFCGESIAVLSLLADSILRLAVAPQSEVVGVPEGQRDYLHALNLPAIGSWIDILIPRRSVYIIRGALRYLLTHAILSNEQVAFMRNGHSVDMYNLHRGRRVSVICRTHAMNSNLIPFYKNTKESLVDVKT
ncbi:Alpha-ketoglutarate-dependent dioxygenase alkB7 [Schistosoma japonicum]|uniref:Alpha-ketoglutarate-dependent dioxygenase alkB7 n=1 Tax=Schistosoma japonicum TaxID=6182 RepID=A0A4Z2CWZ6_SCHJA|nr:Alpha-ketoglutarate-dependent dioxygenase alkB7 [Schistosoma japonicum]